MPIGIGLKGQSLSATLATRSTPKTCFNWYSSTNSATLPACNGNNKRYKKTSTRSGRNLIAALLKIQDLDLTDRDREQHLFVGLVCLILGNIVVSVLDVFELHDELVSEAFLYLYREC